MKLDDAAYMRCASRIYIFMCVFVNVALCRRGLEGGSFSPDVDNRIDTGKSQTRFTDSTIRSFKTLFSVN